MDNKNIRPLVSVLVPICNVEKYLSQCLESIAKQTLDNIEVICINDGSTDGSKEIIERYVSLYDNFVLIDKANSGYGASMNMGLERAKGQYIGIVESDDFIASSMYEDLYELSENGSVDIVKGNFWDYYTEETTSVVKEKAFVNMERAMISEVGKITSLYKCPQLLFGHPSIWSGIYKRELLESNNIRFMEEPGGGWVDNPFFFEVFCAAKGIKWTKKPYYYYRKTNSNSSSNRMPDLTLPIKRMLDNLEVLNKYNVNDEEILKMAYSRGLMYVYGLLEERGYSQQSEQIKFYTEKLMSSLKQDVILNNFNDKDKALYFEHLSPFNRLMTSKKEKILIYNWIQFDNQPGFGGGVNIYCRNLIDTFIKQRPDVEVWFLSSGFTYDASTTECYIRPTYNVYGDRCKTFEVVNSPVPAAQDMILNNPSIAFSNDNLKNVIKAFIEDNGSFSSVHFNNIEGISLDVLGLKKYFSTSKFIYSVHNYIPFCVHGFYFNRDKKCICNPNHTNADCKLCTDLGRRTDISETLYQRALNNMSSDKKIDKKIWIRQMGFDILDSVTLNNDYIEFENIAKKFLNDNMDQMLAVSERVRELSIENGLDGNKVITSYIGTRVAEFEHRKPLSQKENMKVIFLGNSYFFEEKGAPFLINCLRQLEVQYAKRIDLVMTFTNCNDIQLKKDLKHFSSLHIVHGYRHSDLRNLLMDCDLGIVPVLWEDNLPQIAIEMVAMGVPVLASSLGGASELCTSELFKFEGGNSEDFLNKLKHFIDNKDDLELYWKNHSPLVTMDQHLCDIEKIYNLQSPKLNISINFEDYRKLQMELYFYRTTIINKSFATDGAGAENKYRYPIRLVKKFFKNIKEKGILATLRIIKRYVSL